MKNEYKKLMNARPEINQSRDKHVLPFSNNTAGPTHGQFSFFSAHWTDSQHTHTPRC